MKRGHRRRHVLAWIALLPLVLCLVVLALAARNRVPLEDAIDQQPARPLTFGGTGEERQ